MTIALHKPYGTLCRFTDDAGRPTLQKHVSMPGVYPVGRLDLDSEGLLLLSDEPHVTSSLTTPGRTWKSYWVQVEREPDAAALEQLRTGVDLRDGRTRPAHARRVEEPPVGPRTVPIRMRLSIPTCWLELGLQEGKNRQIRRMTAAVGHPTLRLIRFRIGAIELGDLASGHWRELNAAESKWLTSFPLRG